MEAIEQSAKPARAVEIQAALAGLQFGLCGFDAGQAERLSRVLRGVNALAVPFDARLLGQFAGVCDAIVMRLAGAGPEGLQLAAASSIPILVTGPSETILGGAGALYSWPREFMNEPWSEAELLVRLFRSLQPPVSVQGAAVLATRSAPLVLLADDDKEFIDLADATIQSQGIACRAAEDGLTALRLARELLPDLLILDIRMPRLDGFEVLETIRRDYRLQPLRVILLTGNDDPVDVMRGSDLGANDYVVKPVSPNLLLTRIKRLLTAHRPGARQWTRSVPSERAFHGRVAKWFLTGSPYSGFSERP